ncbi:MAG: helix-turn-helix domain-containing protein [Chloroflexi bacterium]|nr:helix-turn-helix domain-containing protein [Chloroflexota bacterium]
MSKKEDIFTIEELSEYLKIPKSTIYKLCQEGKIPGQKVGRHWRFHKNAVDEWLSTKPPVEPGHQRN